MLGGRRRARCAWAGAARCGLEGGGRWAAGADAPAVRRILEACAVKMFRSSLGPNQSDASLCMKKYDHAAKNTQLQFLKQYGA